MCVCGNTSLQEVLNLNEVPLNGYFPTKNQLEEKSTYPLKLLFCDDCKLVQTDSVINQMCCLKTIDIYHLLDCQITLKN